MPARVSPDHLTIAGIMGSIIAAAGYIGTNWSLQWLWLASAGLAINWGGDSLDGTVARLRKIERPHYGFFVDKTADLTSKTVLFLGLALSPCIRFTLCATALIALQIASVYALVSAVIGGTHRITHAGVGPTEIRVLLMLSNLFSLSYGMVDVGTWIPLPHWIGQLTIYDLTAIVISVGTMSVISCLAVRQRRALALADPIVAVPASLRPKLSVVARAEPVAVRNIR